MRIGCKTGGLGDGVSYRESHGQTVRVGRSVLALIDFAKNVNAYAKLHSLQVHESCT